MTADSKNGQLSKISKKQNCYKNVIKTVSDQINLIENENTDIITRDFVGVVECTENDNEQLKNQFDNSAEYYKTIQIAGNAFSTGDYIPYYPKGNGCKEYKIGKVVAFKVKPHSTTILIKKQIHTYCDTYKCLLVKEKQETKEIKPFYLATHRAWKEVFISTRDLCLEYECDENVSIVPILVQPTITE